MKREPKNFSRGLCSETARKRLLRRLETSLIALSHVLRTSFSLVYNTEFDVFAKNFIRVAVVRNKYLIRSHFNLRTYTQIHIPAVVQGGGGGLDGTPPQSF